MTGDAVRWFRHLIRLFFVERRSLTAAVIIFVVCVAGGAATGFWLLFRVAYVVGIGVPLAWVWSRLAASGLRVTVDRYADRAQEGQQIEGRISVENRGLAGKLWLEVEDTSELPGYDARRVISVQREGRRTWIVCGVAGRRGVYTLGPVRIQTGDPFGLFRTAVMAGHRGAVLVFPRATEMPDFYIPLAHLPGEGRYRRPVQTLTPNAAGIRPYAAGDPYNRIHWPSTARTGQMMVKLFELDPASDIWIVLDLHREAHVGEGEDSTEDFAARIAASVARHFLMQNRAVGFLACGSEYHAQEPDRGVQQYTRILEDLALARAQGDVPLPALLTSEARRFGRHTTVLVITPSTDDAWVTALNQLSQRGARPGAILIEPATFGSTRSSLLVFSALAASDVCTYMVRRSLDPARSFETPAVGAGSGAP